MNVDVVDNNVVDELKREASTTSNVHIVATSVEGLVTVHDELLLQFDVHVAAEDDPERLVLDDPVAKRPFFGIDDVVVTVVGDDVDFTISSADSVFAEADGATRKRLPIVGPVRIAPPAVVNRVTITAPAKSSPGRIGAAKQQ